MKKMLLTGCIILLSGCFGDGEKLTDDKGDSGNGSGKTAKLTLTSSASQVEQGGTATLTWIGEAVENCQADGDWSGAKSANGSEAFQLSEPGNQQFNLTCNIIDSSDTLTDSVAVLVVAASGGGTPTLNFTSSKMQVEQGATVDFTWSSELLENCLASGAWSGSKATNGIESVLLSELGSQQFSLSCTVVNSSDTIIKDLTVLVVQATGGETPELSLTSSLAEVEEGQSTLISWTSAAVENCQAGGAWSGPKANSGSESVLLSELGNQQLSLTCDIVNTSNTLTQNTTVLVVAASSGDGPKSGVDGDDPDALFEHFNQYAQ